MPFLKSRSFLESLSKLALSNPFSPEWMKLEEEALGPEFHRSGTVHLWSEEKIREHPNFVLLTERTEKLAKELLEKLKAGVKPNKKGRLLYEHLILYLLYRRHRLGFDELIATRETNTVGELWQEFLEDFDEFFCVLGSQLRTELSPEHVFASFFQVRRAFRHIFDYIVGSSESVIRLREQVWNSIFTRDFHHYLERLHTRMSDFNTLITGDTGTGKELVARAIGMSQYIPFDSQKKQFETDFADSFRAVNLAGMPATLIESELFGHVRGAYTGADCDQKGWLETANDSDALFLDEIGELDHSVQVKLLRAIETRTFYRIGEQDKQEWKGKIIAATNRDLAEEVHEGRFRKDLYYRLCGDVIETPMLRTQLDESPKDLNELVLFATRRVVGDDCKAMATKVRQYIRKKLPKHSWPGNFRELEQCARNIVIRGKYNPVEIIRHRKFNDIEKALHTVAKHGLSADDLLGVYCEMVYEQVGRNYETAGKRIGMNWRTVKKYVQGPGSKSTEKPR